MAEITHQNIHDLFYTKQSSPLTVLLRNINPMWTLICMKDSFKLNLPETTAEDHVVSKVLENSKDKMKIYRKMFCIIKDCRSKLQVNM